MDLQRAALAICAVTVAYVWYKRRFPVPISDIPGPKNPSWIYGHRWWWQCEEIRLVEKKILKEHGAVARWNGIFGEDRLWLADPKAIQYILHGQGPINQYERPYAVREQSPMVVDRGLSWAAGDTHKRQRRAVAPAFGLAEAKALYPHFARCSNALADKFHESISGGESVITNVHSWLSKATLDAIGAGALDYDFGALENTDNKLTKSYMNLIFNAFGTRTKKNLFIMDVSKWAPKGFFAWGFERSQNPGVVLLRNNRTYAHEVAAKLINDKRQELKHGSSRKDVMSLLVNANSTLRPDWRLNDEEIVAQIRTIMFTGHETTARTLSAALWELAKTRSVQEKLRAEVTETLGKIRTRGDSDFSVNDFDSMPYLIAFGKEVLRLYPITNEIARVPIKDDVLPLSKPVVGVSGKVYKELPISAGTYVSISTTGYNLNEDVWGPDAYEFRPERWFNADQKRESSVGVYGNLVTFSGGPRSCIGWRFAIVEMHTFLVTLVRQFDFSLPDDGREIKSMAQGLLTPVVVGEEEKGPQVPLKITAIGDEHW